MNKRSELINNSRYQNKFTLLRNDNKLRFHWNISCSIPIAAPVLACIINVLHNMTFKTKIEQLKIGEHWREYFLWRRHGNDVTLSFGYCYTVIISLYVTIFWLKTPKGIKLQVSKLSVFIIYIVVYVCVPAQCCSNLIFIRHLAV